MNLHGLPQNKNEDGGYHHEGLLITIERLIGY
jgi:hypothetical protein